ncbi:MAG: two-component sensor histidine kinase [Sphingomonas bacterium]|nr:ATP-binding protein [Sphingomonas bacterium]MDB5689361.1 two-component sensor histidine kinase [Sphingomonas bacterium]
MALPGSGLIRFARRAAAPDPGAPTPAELVAVLPAPLLVIDPDGVITEANVAAETLLNLSRTALVGTRAETLIGAALASVPSDAPFAAYEFQLVLPDGRTRRADVTAAPLPDRPGWRVLTIHGAAPDHIVSRRSDREGGTRTAAGAAALLAHEIKNPLSGIRGAAQLLESTCDEGSRDLTRLIRDEVDRITALIDRMEGFTDTRPLDLTPQNIHAILAHVREVAAQGFARNFVLREIYDPSLPAVLGHRDALIQVLLNLMKNAAEAMQDLPGGSITLTTAYRHGVSVQARGGDGRQPLPIEICVIDDGPGAPDELAPHLFDPFVTSKRTGTGIGLALVDKLVADLGGIVEYAREGQPLRTVFRLMLPRARNETGVKP